MVLLFHSAGADVRAAAAKPGGHPVPIKSLVGFERVSIARGATTRCSFEMLASEALGLVNATGERVVYPGQHTLIFQNGEGATSNVTAQVHM